MGGFLVRAALNGLGFKVEGCYQGGLPKPMWGAPFWGPIQVILSYLGVPYFGLSCHQARCALLGLAFCC